MAKERSARDPILVSLRHYKESDFRETCTMKDMQTMAMLTAGWIFRDGDRCEMKTKRICPGVYHVWFEKPAEEA